MAGLVVVAAIAAPASTRGWAAVTPTPPTVQVTTPGSESLLGPGPVTIAGTTTDTATVSSVGLTVHDGEAGQWLQANGTLAAKSYTFVAALGTPSGTTTPWSLTLPAPPNGDFVGTLLAKDASGHKGAATVEFGVGPAPTAADPGYLTLLFGRTQWVATSPQCQPLAGQPTLVQVAQTLQGLTPPRTATGDVIVDRTGTTSEDCVNYQLYPSWSDLATLQDDDGWTMVSGSQDYQYMTSLTPTEQEAESCGSLTEPEGLYAHGDTAAWGMFAYPDNMRSTVIQSSVVSQCFAFARTYVGGRNVREGMKAPWFQQTTSVMGGTCNTPTSSCASMIVKGQAGTRIYYTSPVTLANLMDVAGDEWDVVQFYKLVTGSNLTGKPTWDCTSSNWQLHWTSATELYCENDFLAAVEQIPASVLTVDPATVAEAWDANPAVTAALPPSVQSLTPAGGAPAGGTQVTLSGSGLTGATGVTFAGQAAAAFSVVSPTEIAATSPPGCGTADVQVTTNRGISALGASDEFSYTPTVGGVAPDAGPATGGTQVVINGSGFTNASEVDFGGVPAAAFAATSDTRIVAQSPAGTQTVDVTVTSTGGTSATGPADQFSYVPAVTGVAPSEGPAGAGTVVTVTGAGFTDATAVSFGGVPATSFSVTSDGELTAQSPAGTGTVDVTVTTPTGTSALSAVDQFSYVPVVTGVGPSEGPAAGGTLVTVTGAGFTGATAVSFGGVPATSFSVSSDGDVTAESPAGTGTVDITVTTPAGTSIPSVADQFTYV